MNVVLWHLLCIVLVFGHPLSAQSYSDPQDFMFLLLSYGYNDYNYYHCLREYVTGFFIFYFVNDLFYSLGCVSFSSDFLIYFLLVC